MRSKDKIEGDKIEEESLKIIRNKLDGFPYPEREVIARAIHATADFDFANLLIFKNDPIKKGVKMIREGKDVVTDVNMVRSGINHRSLSKFGGNVKCFIDDENVFRLSEKEGITRSSASFRLFKEEIEDTIVVVGIAPTAIFELCDLIEEGIKPGIIIATALGFVGAKESKEKILEYDIPSIVVRGHKGGSPVAVAIANSLIRLAESGWQ
ncbi:MAG: precorrin-8X methylmutase [Candidatus Hydrothermarchaeota archaeon]